ncbi:AraC family transcriptional regulator [Alkalihalobacillus pseudalcaliphilus]|uniref:AraC family transcriptional regulator n=1 Tax=Alkalihalobacillus pseudalcaliphilus TaxID=79884 RepID=UPI00064DF680|nr:AraC family transcriptional regulator [Alkalihalobacillus pseudalcaliphilus]KMK75080.1 AraC family transcriptional regulator [Alkalihalobacillus pseudalcaliphilus]
MSLLEQMLTFTDEEEEVLRNRHVLQSWYTSKKSFVIEASKFLQPGSEIMIRKHTRFIEFPRHKHDYIEMNYVYHGSSTQAIGKHTVHLNKGELLILNQHIEHQIEVCQKEDIIINFIIQPTFFEYIFSLLNIEGPLYSFLVNSIHNTEQFGQYLHFKCAEEETIQALINTILEEIISPGPFSKPMIKLYVGQLIVELTKKANTLEGVHENSLHNQWMRETLAYIHEEYKHASLTELSRRLNQPDYLISKVVKKQTNKTFKMLLQEKRLDVAAKMLEQTNIPVGVISEEVGYMNFSYFYKIFKKRFSRTPLNYRKEMSLQG